METIQIKIKDPQKGKALIAFLEQLSFVSIETKIKAKKGRKKTLAPLYGIWEGRNIELKTLRNSAWRI